MLTPIGYGYPSPLQMILLPLLLIAVIVWAWYVMEEGIHMLENCKKESHPIEDDQ